MKLQPYHFTVRYRPGSMNSNADVMSRMFAEDEEEMDLDSVPQVFRQPEGGGGEMLGCSYHRQLDFLTWSYRRQP